MIVQRVLDADTVKLAAVAGGSVITAQVLGIDAPEKVGRDDGAVCWGPQASHWARELLTGKKVSVRTDPTQDRVDQYGRHLVYLTLPIGDDYSIRAASKGMAKYYLFDTPVQEAAKIQAAQADAKAAGLGLWGPPCYGDTALKKIVPEQAHLTKPPAPTPVHTHNPPAPGNNCEPGYSPCLPAVHDLDCSDIGHPVQVTGSDPYRLDSDGDGIGCESS